MFNFFSKKPNTFQFLFASVLILYLTLVTLNVNYLDSLKLAVAIVVQIIPGVYLWGEVNQERKVSIPEHLGMGLALGTIMSILTSAFLRGLPIGGFGWAFPFFCTVLFLLSKILYKKEIRFKIAIEPNTFANRMYLVAISIVIYIQVFVWAKWHALNPSEWWKYHLDVPYFEALSNSIAKFGISDNLMKPDLETRYHWFAYGWIGALNRSLSIDPFIVQTRLLPLVAMFMAATVAYSWTRDFTGNALTAYTSTILIVLGPGFAIGSLVLLRSPSSAISAGWALAFSLLLFRCLKSLQVHLLAYFALALLSVAVVGGKGINVLLIGSGVFVLYITRVAQERKCKVKNLAVFLVVMISMILSYFTLIHTQDARSLNFGIYAGWPALMLTVMPFTLGVLVTISKKKQNKYTELQRYGFAVLFVGALLSLVTYDPAGNQVYFLVSAVTISIIPTMISVEKVLYESFGQSIEFIRFRPDQVKESKLISYIVFFVGLLASGTWIYFENTLGMAGDIGRALAPCLIWICIASLAASVVLKKRILIKNFAYSFMILVLATSVTASAIGVGASLVRGPIYAKNVGYVGYGKSTSTSIGAFSTGYIEAGKWIRSNIPSDSRFFTNRQCIDPKSRFLSCVDIWFLASALSQRQFLIEGGAYNIKDMRFVTKMNNEQIVSLRFSLSPGLYDLNYLWNKGVRWGWIDKRVIGNVEWSTFATPVFSNEDVEVIKLADPSTL